MLFKDLHPMNHLDKTKDLQMIYPVTFSYYYKRKEKINEFVNKKCCFFNQMLSANVYLFIYFMPESLDSNIMRIDSNNLHLCNV